MDRSGAARGRHRQVDPSEHSSCWGSTGSSPDVGQSRAGNHPSGQAGSMWEASGATNGTVSHTTSSGRASSTEAGTSDRLSAEHASHRPGQSPSPPHSLRQHVLTVLRSTLISMIRTFARYPDAASPWWRIVFVPDVSRARSENNAGRFPSVTDPAQGVTGMRRGPSCCLRLSTPSHEFVTERAALRYKSRLRCSVWKLSPGSLAEGM